MARRRVTKEKQVRKTRSTADGGTEVYYDVETITEWVNDYSSSDSGSNYDSGSSSSSYDSNNSSSTSDY